MMAIMKSAHGVLKVLGPKPAAPRTSIFVLGGFVRLFALILRVPDFILFILCFVLFYYFMTNCPACTDKLL